MDPHSPYDPGFHQNLNIVNDANNRENISLYLGGGPVPRTVYNFQVLQKYLLLADWDEWKNVTKINNKRRVLVSRQHFDHSPLMVFFFNLKRYYLVLFYTLVIEKYYITTTNRKYNNTENMLVI